MLFIALFIKKQFSKMILSSNFKMFNFKNRRKVIFNIYLKVVNS